MANITFNGANLSAYGLVTPGVAGTHDLQGWELSEQFIPGKDAPDLRLTRRSTRLLSFDCVVVSNTDHADLVSKLSVLRGYLSPDLGFKTLTVTDISSRRIAALCLGFPVRLNAIPYDQTAVEFTLQFRCAVPWWEDVTAQTASVASGSTTGSVNNTGDTYCWPTYTCTVTTTLAGGLTFTVNGKRYKYEAALASSNVLVVDTEACTTTKNGAAAMAGTADDCEYPELVKGSNSITAKNTGFTLGISYRRRYE